MNKKIKFALIGCSRISQKHIEALNNLDDMCLISDVCDINKNLVESICSKYNANGFTDIKTLLENSSADCVIITTPSGLHPKHSIEAMKAGFHVVSEKPMATNLEDAQDMVDVSIQQKKFLFVVKQVRFMEQVQRLKKAISSGRFKGIHLVNVNIFITRPESYFDDSDWRGTKFFDGGALLNQSSHFIDLLIWLLGPVKSVSAFNETLARNIETEDTSTVNLKFESGALASVNTTILTYPNNLENSMTIIGDKGTVKLGGKFINKVERWNFESSENYDYKDGDSLDINISHKPFYENVINSINGNAIPLIDGHEGLKSISLIDRCYKSSELEKLT